MRRTRKYSPGILRSSQLLTPRNSLFFFAASAGIWLPKTYGDVLVDLDATQLPVGPLPTWTNTGSVGGDFISGTTASAVVPEVRTIADVNGIQFLGTPAASGAGTYYVGPEIPSSLGGAGARTIEAWVYNDSPQGEETVFSMGRRGGPDGTNLSFNHSTNPTFGAVGHWGAPDMGWDGKIAFNRWTHVAYTFDPGSSTAAVYFDGDLAYSEVVALNTTLTDQGGAAVHFFVQRQIEIDGNLSTVGVGNIAIAKIKVHDQTLDAAALKSSFSADSTLFGVGDADGDGIPTYFEKLYPFLNPTDASDAAKDQDNDGLSNLDEFLAGTDLTNPDTDGDGLKDGDEIHRANPTNPKLRDSDQDGLQDGAETSSDPSLPDTDGDGFLDGVEVNHGSDPSSAASFPDLSEPKAIVALDASGLPVGPLAAWPNAGSMGQDFVANSPANVVVVADVKGVSLNGTQWYVGPSAPLSVTGNGSRSVEAWVYNPSAPGEETIFAWGRRGGPAGSNTSFNHGTDTRWGAVGHWDAPDIGWNGTIAIGRWTHVVYTYDGEATTTRVYTDGAEANTEVISALNTWPTDSLGRQLPFVVGNQNEADGSRVPNLAGNLTIAKLNVFDTVLTPDQISERFLNDSVGFGIGDADGDGLPTFYEKLYSSFLNPADPSDAAKDQDGDGLTNLQEFNAGTRPDVADTDGDGISDGAELGRTVGGAPAPTSPLRADTDQDGLSDSAEVATDPLLADTDADTFPDGQEVMRGSDPLVATSIPSLDELKTVVDLDASKLPLGFVTSWRNQGWLGGDFVSSGAPVVQDLANGRGITFDGVSDYLTGPAAPVFVTANSARSVDAWIYNPVAADEETIFSWGRRGGAAGSNCSFNHGGNALFGAVGHWDSPDIGWAGHVIVGRWTHVAYVFNPTDSTTTVYSNGEQANTEPAGPLNTWSVDDTTAANPLPFRVASQNDSNGTPTGGLRGSMSIARLRVYDQTLTGEQIAAIYQAEQYNFGRPSLTAAYNSTAKSVALSWTAVDGVTYTVETSEDLNNWTTLISGLTTGSYTDQNLPAGIKARFYRLTVQ